MKYYSELTNRIYDNEEDLKAAETTHNEKIAEQKKKAEERKADYQKVKDAFALAEAQKKAAEELLIEFTKKYNGVHETRDTASVMSAKDYAEKQKELLNIVFGTLPFIF